MKVIIVKDYEILVDDEDYEWVKEFTIDVRPHQYWPNYIIVALVIPTELGGGRVPLGRAILCPDEDKECDHINGSTLDNRKENLRQVDHRENGRNRHDKDKTSSEYVGVDFHRNTGKWRAHIRVGLCKKCLGYFVQERDAAQAYIGANLLPILIYRNKFIHRKKR